MCVCFFPLQNVAEDILKNVGNQICMFCDISQNIFFCALQSYG